MEITFISAHDDGSVDMKLPDHVYLHLVVMEDGNAEGRLSGYFHPSTAQHIRQLLGVKTIS